jgi:hypothetical protein
MFFKIKKLQYIYVLTAFVLYFPDSLNFLGTALLSIVFYLQGRVKAASPWKNSQTGVIIVLIRTNIDEKPQHSDSVKVKLWVSSAVEALESHQKKSQRT